VAKTLPLSEFQRTILLDGANQTVFLGGLVAVVTAAVFCALGLYLSSKFIGPLNRLERWLEQHLAGQNQLAFKLRKGDELSDTAKLLFKVLEKHKGKI
jgi:methyl-accepting chemotaxis protein